MKDHLSQYDIILSSFQIKLYRGYCILPVCFIVKVVPKHIGRERDAGGVETGKTTDHH